MFMLKSNMSGIGGWSVDSPWGLIAAFFAGSSFTPSACPQCPEIPACAACNCHTGLSVVLALIGAGFLLGVWAKSHPGRGIGLERAFADPTKGKGASGKGQWLGRIAD